MRGLELTSLYVLNACPGQQRSAWQLESAGSRTWIDTRWPEPRLSRSVSKQQVAIQVKLEPKSWDWQLGHCTGESGRRVLGEQLRGRSGQAL